MKNHIGYITLLVNNYDEAIANGKMNVTKILGYVRAEKMK